MINYTIFRKIYITFTADGITEKNLNLIDFGDIRLSREGREYQLDYFSYDMFYDEDDNSVDIQATFGSFEDAKECFEDCPFDLLESDLVADDLKVTVFIDCFEDKNVKNIKFVNGDIMIHSPNLNIDSIPINGLDE